MGTITRNRNPRFYTGDEFGYIGEYTPNGNPPLPPNGGFLLPMCLDLPAATKLLSAAALGAAILYGEQRDSVLLPLLQSMEFVNDIESAECVTINRNLYRIENCALQVSTDNGATWQNVPNSTIDCADDGRTPELRAVDFAQGATIIEWKYTDEPASAWRKLAEVEDGEDGRTPELRVIPNGARCVTYQWRYVGESDSAWRNLSTVCDGADGNVSVPQTGNAIVIPAGTIVAYSTTSAPVGTVPCNGAVYNRTQYPKLYDAIAPVYRINQNEFRVPNLIGRVVMGSGNQYSIGSNLGTEFQTLTTQNMPAHTHDVIDSGHVHEQRPMPMDIPVRAGATGFGSGVIALAGSSVSNDTRRYSTISGAPNIVSTSVGSSNISIANSGSGLPFDNRQASHVLGYAIYVEDVSANDGLTPEFKAEKENGVSRLYWRYVGEGDEDWRLLTNVHDGQNGQTPNVEFDVIDCNLAYRVDNGEWVSLYDFSRDECDDDEEFERPSEVTDANVCYASKRIVAFLERMFQDALNERDAAIDEVEAANSSAELVTSLIGSRARRGNLFRLFLRIYVAGSGTDLVEQIEASMTVLRREQIEQALYCSGYESMTSESLQFIALKALEVGYGTSRNGEFSEFVSEIGHEALRTRYNAYLMNTDNSCLPCGDCQSRSTLHNAQTGAGAPVLIDIPKGCIVRVTIENPPLINPPISLNLSSWASLHVGTHYTTNRGLSWTPLPAVIPNSGLVSGLSVNGRNPHEIAINGVTVSFVGNQPNGFARFRSVFDFVSTGHSVTVNPLRISSNGVAVWNEQGFTLTQNVSGYPVTIEVLD